MIQAFLGRQDEFKYANVFIEYEVCDGESSFVVVKECGIDPQLVDGCITFPVLDYVKEFPYNWMKMMIEDITSEIENNIDPTHIEVLIEEMRHMSFEVGRPKYKNEK